VKTGEANFRFPILGFTPDKDIWGFPDLNRLTSSGPRSLKENRHIGLELIDADGRRWVVRAVSCTGRAGPLLPWIIGTLLSATPQSRVELELEPLTPVTLSEMQSRACASLEAFPDYYCEDDERETVLEPLLTKIKATTDIGQVYELLQPDTFEPH
jgi:hypothetical protein